MIALEQTDGVHIPLTNGNIIHLRLSDNLLELCCCAASKTIDQAIFMISGLLEK